MVINSNISLGTSEFISEVERYLPSCSHINLLECALGIAEDLYAMNQDLDTYLIIEELEEMILTSE